MYFWLGPLGDLRELPPIEQDQDVDATPKAPVGEHVSLEGAVSQDRLGRKRRTWVLPWVYLDPDQADDIDALCSGHYGFPLWLLDPQRPNLAPRQVAAAGAELHGVDGWTADAGTVEWAPLRGPGLRPAGVRSIGSIVWTLADGEEGTLSVGRLDRFLRAPVCPHGGVVNVAAWTRRVGGDPADAVFGVDLFDTAGGRTDPTAPAVALGTSWLDMVSVTAPAVTDVSFAPSWAAVGPCVIQVCGVRYGHGPTPPAPSAGGGSAMVLPQGETPESYPGQGEITTSLTLVEA